MMYFLLKHYNLYDQMGGYFVGVFTSRDKLRASISEPLGRQADEESWYEMEVVDVNEYFDQED